MRRLVAAAAPAALLAAALPASAQIDMTAPEMFGAWCARCHAADGSGRVAEPTVTVEPMDFTDCAVATPEPDADWDLVIRRGGLPAGLSAQMPAFGDVLNDEQVRGLVAYLRTFCTDPGWPLGNLNFPRPIVTEKAFPENELVILPVVGRRRSEPVAARLKAVFERRVGRRAHVEIGVPAETLGSNGARVAGLSDVNVAGKYVLHAAPGAGGIVTAGLELVWPTGSEARGLGSGTTVFEPYLAAGRLWRDLYLQGQIKLELPAREPWSDRELVYNLYVGRDLSPTPDTWTIGFELNGVANELAVTPQVRKGLTRTGALAAAAGLRLPLVTRDVQPTRVVGYLLWEYLEPVRARP